MQLYSSCGAAVQCPLPSVTSSWQLPWLLHLLCPAHRALCGGRHVSCPGQMSLQVVEAAPTMKGETAAPSYKRAVVEGGIEVRAALAWLCGNLYSLQRPGCAAAEVLRCSPVGLSSAGQDAPGDQAATLLLPLTSPHCPCAAAPDLTPRTLAAPTAPHTRRSRCRRLCRQATQWWWTQWSARLCGEGDPVPSTSDLHLYAWLCLLSLTSGASPSFTNALVSAP